MQIRGFQRLSLIDYPGRIAAVVWTGGCNLRCGWCFNRDIVTESSKAPVIPERTVLYYLEANRKWLDGVVITGGEPTLQPDLAGFCARVKALRLLVKLDTNGTNPEVVARLMKRRLVDYVAMDVKAPLEWPSYRRVTGMRDKRLFEGVKQTARLLLGSKTDYEFRTTIVPGLVTKADILRIAKQLRGARRYAIQQFLPEPTCINRKFSGVKPYSKGYLVSIGKAVSRYFRQLDIRA